MAFIAEYVYRVERCYAVIISKCVTRKNGVKDCKEEGYFRFEVITNYSFCGTCENQ